MTSVVYVCLHKERTLALSELPVGCLKEYWRGSPQIITLLFINICVRDKTRCKLCSESEILSFGTGVHLGIRSGFLVTSKPGSSGTL